MENINKLEIVPDEVYEIGADKAPVIPEWSVKDDATLYEKVNKLAHSTFDRSKFTVVGSPNITNDGIASGFSTSNYISTITFGELKDKSWEIKGEFTQTTASGWRTVLGTATYQVQWGLTFYSGTTGISFYSKFGTTEDGDTSESAKISIGTASYSVGTKIQYKLSFDINTGTYNLAIKSKEEANWHYGTPFTPTTSNKQMKFINTNPNYKIRIGASSNTSWDGSIDLKQFGITVDEVEVFSGNKTGIDTIKPDDYTVVGTPTISADGVASGLSSSNYLKILNSVFYNIGTKNWRIEWSGNLPAKTGSPYPYVLGNNFTNTDSFINCGHFNNSDNWFFNVCVNDNETPILTSATYLTPPSADYRKPYKCYIEFTGTKYIMGLKTASMSSFTTIEVENSNPIMPQLNDLALGYAMSNGSIDLNSFKIYVDGDLVYQPCLKIPYTEGQNYVKVVDKLYRDRVKDLFEQKGYNGYYTIGEDDFTLPSNKWSDVIEHKENGLTVAEQRVDQTLTIRGACEQGVDVNLPMEFFSADSYAVFGVGTTGTNTASKFTPAADGNYIAIGKGKV